MADDIAQGNVTPTATDETGPEDELRVELINVRTQLTSLLQTAALTTVHLRDAHQENAALLDHVRFLEHQLKDAVDRAYGAEMHARDLIAHMERTQADYDGLHEHTDRVQEWADGVAAHRDAIEAHRDAVVAQLERDAPMARRYERLAASRPARILRRVRRVFRI